MFLLFNMLFRFVIAFLLELTPERDVFFIIGYWNAKVGSQEIPGVTDIFGLGVQNEIGQSLQSIFKRTHWS